MPIFKIKNSKLEPIKEKSISLEKDIQKITEENLELLFGLKFVSGSLNQEFSIKVNEQEFYIDTLAFNEQDKSIVIIEYKKDKSFSVIDQGFAYLNAMLRNQAEFVLEINKRLKKNFGKEDIDWEQSRIIFISKDFTNYQVNAINFKDLPIFLYKVRVYSNNLIEYDAIEPYKTTISIKVLSKDKIIQKVSKEVKVYTVDDLVRSNWTDTYVLLDEFEKEITSQEIETRIKYTKYYIAYMSKHGRNYVEIVPQQQGLKVYFRFPAKSVKSILDIKDCSKVGHWTNGVSYINLTQSDQIPEVTRLAKESFKYLHRDIYKD
jgi:predicted transport protein